MRVDMAPTSRWPQLARRARLPLPRNLPPLTRYLLVLGHDVAAAALSFPAAVLLREGTVEFPDPTGNQVYMWLPLFLLIFATIAWSYRIQYRVWLFASTRDLLAITKVS